MATFTKADAIAAETYWARQLHVPEELAHATAEVESHHNPYAVGDHGTSFGDYQLHRGGMLGSLTPLQAYDPMVNARIAIQSLASTLQRYPGLDYGHIAALSQRPADPEGYAAKVNTVLHAGPVTTQAGSPQVSQLAFNPVAPVTGGASWLWDHSGGWVLHGVGNAAGDVGGAIAAPFVAIFNLMKTIWDFFTSADTWVRIALFVGGGLIVIIGVKAIVAPDAPMPIPVPV